MLTVSILAQIQPELAAKLKSAFLFLPNYCFGQGLSDIFTNYQNLAVVHTLTPLCQGVLDRQGKPFSIQACCSLKTSVDVQSVPYQIDCETNYWAFSSPGIGQYALGLVLQAVVFFGLILAIEARVFSFALRKGEPNVGVPEDEDEDLRNERLAVEEKVGYRYRLQLSTV